MSAWTFEPRELRPGDVILTVNGVRAVPREVFRVAPGQRDGIWLVWTRDEEAERIFTSHDKVLAFRFPKTWSEQWAEEFDGVTLRDALAWFKERDWRILKLTPAGQIQDEM